MRYNKIFQYEKNGVHKRTVTVTNDLKVETKLIPNWGLPLLAKELSTVVIKNEYNRINPYDFDTVTDRHIYIMYAEPRSIGYKIMKKLIIRRTHGGYFKIPEGTFLYDVLDYFVEVRLLDKNYKFIGNLKEDIGMSVIEPVNETVINSGFKNENSNTNYYNTVKVVKVYKDDSFKVVENIPTTTEDIEPATTTDQLLDKYNDYMLLHNMFGDQYYMTVAGDVLNQLRG